ncbi:MAG: hypothetical protein EOO34_00635 [Cyanobacteriota bacterium]|nr:MAG: hypothetical protein EOO34_00635 [Cyanobacteriota bacterium]
MSRFNVMGLTKALLLSAPKKLSSVCFRFVSAFLYRVIFFKDVKSSKWSRHNNKVFIWSTSEKCKKYNVKNIMHAL